MQILMKESKIEDFAKILKNMRIDFELFLESFRMVLGGIREEYKENIKWNTFQNAACNDFRV